ncbi:DNA-3-methyladenine glycosylase [Paroedura picta]|uniref:DNA-3-methyladenine glycosylase n=1 Tax=Paroedura picta TaxID=143630 RepID=UPI004056312F
MAPVGCRAGWWLAGPPSESGYRQKPGGHTSEASGESWAKLGGEAGLKTAPRGATRLLARPAPSPASLARQAPTGRGKEGEAPPKRAGPAQRRPARGTSRPLPRRRRGGGGAWGSCWWGWRGRGGREERRLGSDFFAQPCVSLAKALLGQVLARRLADGRAVRGRIVETEAYLGGEDSASHSRGGRRTARNAAMFMAPGTLYVYQIYGLYFCLNVSSQGEGAAVLLRALEPVQGLEAMRELRQRQRRGPARPPRDWQLCNGPSKLCVALAIDKSFDRQDLASARDVWLEPGPDAPPDARVVCSARVGIRGDWAHRPLRFYLRGNRSVSVADKAAERAAGEAPQDGPQAAE